MTFVKEGLEENGEEVNAIGEAIEDTIAVSYTHLDVYKRQAHRPSAGVAKGGPGFHEGGNKKTAPGSSRTLLLSWSWRESNRGPKSTASLPKGLAVMVASN